MPKLFRTENWFTYSRGRSCWGREYQWSSSRKAWKGQGNQNDIRFSNYKKKIMSEKNNKHTCWKRAPLVWSEERCGLWEGSKMNLMRKRKGDNSNLAIGKRFLQWFSAMHICTEAEMRSYPGNLPWRWNTGQWCTHRSRPHGAALGLCHIWGSLLQSLAEEQWADKVCVSKRMGLKPCGMREIHTSTSPHQL